MLCTPLEMLKTVNHHSKDLKKVFIVASVYIGYTPNSVPYWPLTIHLFIKAFSVSIFSSLDSHQHRLVSLEWLSVLT